ncbi:MAG: DNA translocase FtsK 4TM domain-containing protein [Xanthomonadaceae bacterium]|nr:DNA translocase FtsK 4TM domain-containing protein [Xanthomonadaceae bacterium]
MFVFSAVALLALLALFTYDPADPGWSRSGSAESVVNAGGWFGAWFADVALYLFGYVAYLVPVMLAYAGWLLFRGRNAEARQDRATLIGRVCGFVLTVMTGAGLTHLHFSVASGSLPVTTAGGVLGDVTGGLFVSVFSFLGGTLLLLALFLAGVTLFTSLSWLALVDVTGRLALDLGERTQTRWYRLLAWIDTRRARREQVSAVRVQKEKVEKRIPVRIEPVVKAIEPSVRAQKERQVPLFETSGPGELPSLSLLDPAPERKVGYSETSLEAMSRQVEMKLRDFGIEVEVVAVHPGPVITRFELQPAPGVKVSQITTLAKDLARSLAAISVRVVEVIPGKPTVGLELPNEVRELVALSEILTSKEYDAEHSPLTLALGKDISGYPVVADLTRMPHLLVAGTTGSGKSVAINAMVLSLLYKATPEQVRVIMIDPKMLELSVYEGIPHLLAPVVTDMKQAANALRWAVFEMDRRYRLMSALGVRNIAGFNRKLKDGAAKGQPIRDPLFRAPPPFGLDEGEEPPEAPILEPLPYIVVIVDELADMMMVVGKKVEELIARLAQKARASGIHLILATQRPSVDVITGLIKANIPTRIAFQVSSRIDSRTILDQQGAEQLLGHGDMLYLPPGSGVPQRVHGAFVSDAEVHRVANDLRKQGEPSYIDEILEGPSAPTGGGGADATLYGGDEGASEQDALYDQAVRIVTESRKASISGVQRRLKIGYNRAARMIEEMEATGVVGPLQSNGTREVLAPPPPKD